MKIKFMRCKGPDEFECKVKVDYFEGSVEELWIGLKR